MKIRFLSLARLELIDTIEFYDYQSSLLGQRFYKEFKISLQRIKEYPNSWPKLGKRTRRCIIKGFPYAIFYWNTSEEIIITAISHMHRNPVYYKDRII